MVYKCISKENLFSKVPGGPIFSRRIQLFQGGGPIAYSNGNLYNL